MNEILKSESGCSIVMMVLAFTKNEVKFKLLRKITQVILIEIHKLAKATHGIQSLSNSCLVHELMNTIRRYYYLIDSHRTEIDAKNGKPSKFKSKSQAFRPMNTNMYTGQI